jgi:hypothetical protein
LIFKSVSMPSVKNAIIDIAINKTNRTMRSFQLIKSSSSPY